MHPLEYMKQYRPSEIIKACYFYCYYVSIFIVSFKYIVSIFCKNYIVIINYGLSILDSSLPLAS